MTVPIIVIVLAKVVSFCFLRVDNYYKRTLFVSFLSGDWFLICLIFIHNLMFVFKNYLILVISYILNH